MAVAGDVSHGDLLLAIGQMQGKLDALVTTMSQQRTDVSEAFRRISEAEKRIAQGVILCVAVSILVPIGIVAYQQQLPHGHQVETPHRR